MKPLMNDDESTHNRPRMPDCLPASFHSGTLFCFCSASPRHSSLGASEHSVQGRVSDATGAVIPSATVTAVNVETGVSRTTTGSATGDYSITLLPPGDYTVTAEHSGFQKSAKKVHLDIGAAAT